jgi:alkaline phosphatase
MSLLPRKSLRRSLCTGLTLVLSVGLVASQALAQSKACFKPKGHGPKNIIILIGDGMGYNHVDAGAYWMYGHGRSQVYQRFSQRLGMSTYSANNPAGYDPAQAWTLFSYVKAGPTDSASAATAMSTGVKNWDGTLGVDCDYQPLVHLMQKAEGFGKATGVVTSVEFSHATPAGFVAHNKSRNNYTQIALEMIRDSACEVVMGCGHPEFDDNAQPRETPKYSYIDADTWDALVNGTPCADADGDGVQDPWALVESTRDFRRLINGRAPKRVCGVPTVYSTLQQSRGGDGYANPYAVPLTDNLPTLAEMSQGALNVLDADRDGFVLMIEGGAIDWASHGNQSGRLIEEQVDFNKAVEAVCRYLRRQGLWDETLVIVTADHECGYLTGPGSDPNWNPVVNNGCRRLPGMEWHSGNHTNSLVPFYAEGPGAKLFAAAATGWDTVRGAFLDNTAIGNICASLLD